MQKHTLSNVAMNCVRMYGVDHPIGLKFSVFGFNGSEPRYISWLKYS